MKIVGLDLSLASTGVAVITDHGTTTHTICSKPTKTPTLLNRTARLYGIKETVLDHVRGADLAVIEAPAYDSRTGFQHERSGLWWAVVKGCLSLGIETVEVTQGSVKKYATGKGNAHKDQVLAAVVRRYLEILVDGNDQADALVLAAMGARAYGRPIETSLPQLHLDAMRGVQWPEMAGVA